MAEQSDCKKQLVKIAENNVELQYYLLSPVDMSKVILPEYTVSYGQTKIDTDRAQADSDWAFWDGLSAADVAAQITEAQKQVAYFNDVQDVMNAIDGTVVELD